MVMLETTGQLQLVPFVAVAALVGVAAAGTVTGHGLYHALIESAGIPYLPLERPPEYDDAEPHTLPPDSVADKATSCMPFAAELCGWVAGHGPRPFLCRPWEQRGAIDDTLVEHVMSRAPLTTVRFRRHAPAPTPSPCTPHPLTHPAPLTPSHPPHPPHAISQVRFDDTRRALVFRFGDSALSPPHAGLPVVSGEGQLVGLLLWSELMRGGYDDDVTVDRVMDRCPCTCHAGWPVQRAHRLFSSMGLRHLVVLGSHMQPVGLVTRHDLQHGVAHARRRDRSRTTSRISMVSEAPREGAREELQQDTDEAAGVAAGVQPLPPPPPPHMLSTALDARDLLDRNSSPHSSSSIQ